MFRRLLAKTSDKLKTLSDGLGNIASSGTHDPFDKNDFQRQIQETCASLREIRSSPKTVFDTLTDASVAEIIGKLHTSLTTVLPADSTFDQNRSDALAFFYSSPSLPCLVYYILRASGLEIDVAITAEALTDSVLQASDESFAAVVVASTEYYRRTFAALFNLALLLSSFPVCATHEYSFLVVFVNFFCRAAQTDRTRLKFVLDADLMVVCKFITESVPTPPAAVIGQMLSFANSDLEAQRILLHILQRSPSHVSYILLLDSCHAYIKNLTTRFFFDNHLEDISGHLALQSEAIRIVASVKDCIPLLLENAEGTSVEATCRAVDERMTRTIFGVIFSFLGGIDLRDTVLPRLLEFTASMVTFVRQHFPSAYEYVGELFCGPPDPQSLPGTSLYFYTFRKSAMSPSSGFKSFLSSIYMLRFISGQRSTLDLEDSFSVVPLSEVDGDNQHKGFIFLLRLFYCILTSKIETLHGLMRLLIAATNLCSVLIGTSPRMGYEDMQQSRDQDPPSSGPSETKESMAATFAAVLPLQSHAHSRYYRTGITGLYPPYSVFDSTSASAVADSVETLNPNLVTLGAQLRQTSFAVPAPVVELAVGRDATGALGTQENLASVILGKIFTLIFRATPDTGGSAVLWCNPVVYMLIACIQFFTRVIMEGLTAGIESEDIIYPLDLSTASPLREQTVETLKPHSSSATESAGPCRSIVRPALDVNTPGLILTVADLSRDFCANLHTLVREVTHIHETLVLLNSRYYDQLASPCEDMSVHGFPEIYYEYGGVSVPQICNVHYTNMLLQTMLRRILKEYASSNTSTVFGAFGQSRPEKEVLAILRMIDDSDVNAGSILLGRKTLKKKVGLSREHGRPSV